jgi:hypothetical protein
MAHVGPQRHKGKKSDFEQKIYARKKKVDILIRHLLRYVPLFYIKTQTN